MMTDGLRVTDNGKVTAGTCYGYVYSSVLGQKTNNTWENSQRRRDFNLAESKNLLGLVGWLAGGAR